MKGAASRIASSQAAQLVAACACWLAATAWVRPLMAPDEGRYVGVALAMLQSGDWLVPRLDGLPFFHKPPLFYWISAGAMAMAGPIEWAARLPSVLGATVSAGSLFLFLRRWSTPPQARLSLLVLATMPFFFVAAQFANLDMLVAGCISAAVLLGAGAVLAREREDAWRHLLAGAFLFAAAGILAKGLIGILLPGCILVAWCLATRRFSCARLALWPPGWLLLIAVAGPWFIAMQLRFPAFFDYFVVTQHFRRFASSGFNNEHGFWFYLPVIAAFTLPWFGWLLVPRRAAPETRRRLSDIEWLMWIWLAVVVVFFSVPRSKLVGYVLPALAPLACLIAGNLQPGDHENRLPPKLRATAFVSAALCVLIVAGVARFAVPPGARLRLPVGLSVASGDQVLMLDSYHYEIPFYWHLRAPVLVSGYWKSPKVGERDNWRKELGDAARFDPALAENILIDSTRLAATLCVPQTSWLIGPQTALISNPWLAHVRVVASSGETTAWRFAGSDARDAHCLDMPPAPGSNGNG